MPVGLAVGVGGLVGAAQHNGKRGTVASGPDPISGRYKVQLDGGGNGGRPLGLLPANLRLLGPEGLEPPIHGGPITAAAAPSPDVSGASGESELLVVVRNAQAQNPGMGFKRLVLVVKKALPEGFVVSAKEVRTAIATLKEAADQQAAAEPEPEPCSQKTGGQLPQGPLGAVARAGIELAGAGPGKQQHKPPRDHGFCAAAGCELAGLKQCGKCTSVWYCGSECQKKHWKLHKPICKHVREGKGEKLRQSELQIVPWTRATPYEVRDADFERFEKRFEREIAAFAEESYRSAGGAEPGLVIVALEKQRRPLDLRWAPLSAVNRPGGACVNPHAIEEIRKDHAAGALRSGPQGQYVVMATWSGAWPVVDAEMKASFKRWSRDFPFKNKTWRQFWKGDWPINWLSFGGRGSTVYTGPVGAAGFMEQYGQDREAAAELKRALGHKARNVTPVIRVPLR